MLLFGAAAIVVAVSSGMRPASFEEETRAWRVASNANVLGSRRGQRASVLREKRLHRELEKCESSHRDLDAEISSNPFAEASRVLKKRKLALRDRIAALSAALQSGRHGDRQRSMLGAGAAGEVYAAYTATTNEAYAAKVARGSERIADLRREYEAMKRLRAYPGKFSTARYFSPEVPSVSLPATSSSSSNETCAVLIMDRLGPSVEDLLWSLRCGCGGLSESGCLSLARRLLPTLQTLKRARMVHGDIKPDNVLVDLDDGDRLFLVDFGVALEVGSEREGRRENGGTPRFASKGVRSGRAAREADDCESFAHTLRYLRTGGFDIDLGNSPTLDFADALCREADWSVENEASPDYAALTLLLNELSCDHEDVLDWVHVGVRWDHEGIIDVDSCLTE